MNKKLLAVSGGPDSMFLLNKYKNEDIVVAHVNYNKRDDSWVDEQIVRNFCLKHNINLEVLNIEKNHDYKGNFQEEARNIRYQFFYKIYNKYQCSELLVAHHLDDFLETCLMQEEKHVEPLYFGIYERIFNFNMNIFRPLLFSFRKADIIRFLNTENIKFAIDTSNEKPIYKRNEIRIKIKQMSDEEFRQKIKYFINKNTQNQLILENINREFNIWKSSNFDCAIFKNFKYQNQLIFKLIHIKFKNIELSKNKINSIKQFICSTKHTSSFLLKNYIYLKKQKNYII
ncbi:tRNA lysidine(34) synthetase TilS [Mycoplasma phocimorsus]|uniref:tRNA lysidine(34) synthetase TilS n=1 Tax=Mycoplasma phocimorsus TaxID=3045839 RepID=UPI0024C00918|nr:tRNA lysidine(34) synthetase TilS [Mycoplasma phocimorsus]MDJ1648254.1 tRNA lysidine(34) synthetase TilS [Mycoplasma phocimorsus]